MEGFGKVCSVVVVAGRAKYAVTACGALITTLSGLVALVGSPLKLVKRQAVDGVAAAVTGTLNPLLYHWLTELKYGFNVIGLAAVATNAPVAGFVALITVATSPVALANMSLVRAWTQSYMARPLPADPAIEFASAPSRIHKNRPSSGFGNHLLKKSPVCLRECVILGKSDFWPQRSPANHPPE